MMSDHIKAAEKWKPSAPFSLDIELPQNGCDLTSFVVQTAQYQNTARAITFAIEKPPHLTPESVHVRIFTKPAPDADCYYYGILDLTTEEKSEILVTGEFHCAMGHRDRSGTAKEQYYGPWYFVMGEWKKEKADEARIEKLLYGE
jgi:hypothetical protein